MRTRNKLRSRNSTVSQEAVIIDQRNSPGKCRVCLDDGDIPIFGSKDISNDVAEFGKIKINANDNFPKYLCEACYTLLEAAILFRKTAKQANAFLKKNPWKIPSSAASDDSNYINENEPEIKREYLELDNTSESELDDFDKLRLKIESEDETIDYLALANNHMDMSVKSEDGSVGYRSASEADTQETNYMEHSQLEDIDESKNDEDETVADPDSEMIMIIVSDKDKQNQITPICEKCNTSFDNIDDLLQHIEKTHPKPGPDERECDICRNVVKRNLYKVHLKEHREKYQEKHIKKYGKVECEICNKKISKAYYKYHIKMHGTAEEQAERTMECTICKKSFGAHYFNDHMKRVHDKKMKHTKQSSQKPVPKEVSPKNVKKTKCPVCDKKVKESEYKQHLAKHGGPLRRYICDKCGKVFKHPSAFRTHYMTHGTELKYKCQFCPYRGLHQGLLKIHVRTHTGDYNYKCTECPAKFITKSNLSKHIQRHKGQCNYKCEICNKGFYSKRDLNKHNNIVHLKLRNHVCESCGKVFGHRDNMLSHQLKVHKREKIITKGRMPSYLKTEEQL
ncbi:zinc finger protein 39-like [Trichoplusia ni]|uniref:Zinc finger protein 39-like n=1 Tax=Trichoplusia ni TaxID=7111 RepID=A0A7E5VLK1_TRINI|nr:zinc finger protein 39-like [Trichoplusia ni]